MERPCCLGVARDASSLIGKECSVGDATAYVATPASDSTRKKVGVLVVHDIWGWRIPNAKYIADFMSSNGCTRNCKGK